MLATATSTGIATRSGACQPTCSCTTPLTATITGTMPDNAAPVLPDVSRHR